jgi:hypothetical protein
VGNGLTWNNGQGAVLTLTVFEGIAGPSLYAGGQINFGALNENPIVARWDGVSWHPVAAWLPGYFIASLAVADYGGTPSLHAAIYPYSQGQGTVFRLDGNEWVEIGDTAPHPVRTLAAFERAGASLLYAGGEFSAISGVSVPRFARWDGKHWSALPQGGSSSSVHMFRTLDLGDGPRLYALGSSGMGSQPLPGIGRYDGERWSPVGPPGPPIGIADVEVYDDGTGAMLYGALFSYSGSGHHVVRLNGGAWEPVGLATAAFAGNGIRRLRAFDDGTGSKLFAGGDFNGGVRAWDGVTWTTPGGGLPVFSGGFGLRDFEVFDGGVGARLYAAWASSVSRWTGSEWELVGGPFSKFSGLFDLAVFDDGAGRALYVATGLATHPIVRYDGRSWTIVASGSNGTVWALGAFDDSGGPALYATGDFTMIGGVCALRIARWRGGTWSGIGGGLDGTGVTLAAFDLPTPALWVGGNILSAGGFSSSGLARWIGCGASCYADCDASGSLAPADFACFQAQLVAGSPYADCNADGALTVADFGCFQTRFVLGCP